MRTHLIRVPFCLAIVGLLAALGSTNAQNKKGKGVSPYAPLVSELHQTRVLLHQADHDYQGHRVKAMHEIGQAMNALHPHHKHKLGVRKGGGGNENQAVSDMQLAQAGKQLQVVLNQLNNGAANANTAKAAMHVQNAMAQLNTALKIR
jgi:hypothetical protein